jgi:hypothetical protein
MSQFKKYLQIIQEQMDLGKVMNYTPEKDIYSYATYNHKEGIRDSDFQMLDHEGVGLTEYLKEIISEYGINDNNEFKIALLDPKKYFVDFVQEQLGFVIDKKTITTRDVTIEKLGQYYYITVPITAGKYVKDFSHDAISLRIKID